MHAWQGSSLQNLVNANAPCSPDKFDVRRSFCFSADCVQPFLSKVGPDPQGRAIAYFVREPFSSISMGTSLKAGKLSDGSLSITSRMNDGGTIFADGMEQDFLRFDWGQRLTLRPSDRALQLVVP